MDIIKVIAVMLVSLSACSCVNESTSQKTEMVSYEEYQATVDEYKSLNKRQEAIISQNIANEALISEIVSELRTLTTAAGTLRVDVEAGTGTISRSDEIKARLKELRQKLGEASRKASPKEKQYLQTIHNLEDMIVQKEKEVDALKLEIQIKDKEIEAKAKTIKIQENTIEIQRKEMILRQINAWEKMGTELYQVATSLPAVKGKKDKDNMSYAKLYIFYRAKKCFVQAKELGSSRAESEIRNIESEICAL